MYDIVDEDVRGGLKAKAAYLKEVHAGNAGQEPHTVVLFDGNKVKQVKTNNARYGFLASSNKPVSYTHLDVYKRQIHFIERFSLNSFPEETCNFLIFTDRVIWDSVFFTFSGKAYCILSLIHIYVTSV